MDGKTPPRVAVLIATYNRANLLGDTLDCLAASTVPAGLTWEVIVVDNNSTDRTKAVVLSRQSGYPVRLSGEDSGRGTFSQRHSVLIDQETEERHVPLMHVSDKQAQFEVVDSPLSEASVLGFDYGYSIADPNWSPYSV